MKIIDLIQGSPEWHAHRAQHFNASDAAAMMGADKNGNTRTALLQFYAIGKEKEVSDFVQKHVFDKGHEAEAAARSIVEARLGEELFPATGTEVVDGLNLSASFDGINALGDTTWENKLLNAGLVEQIEAGEIEPHYYWQLEHQLLVSGAEKTYFTTSDGTEENTHGIFYESVPERRAKLIAGWKQFAEDLANYNHVEAKPEAVAAPIEALPALLVQVEGRVVATNLDVFKEKAGAFIASIKTELVTDQDFADADKMAKFLGDGEKQLAAVKMQAQAQAQSIDEVFRAIDAISEQMRATRLKLEKLVKAEKENRKGEIIGFALNELKTHIYKLNERIGGDFMPANLVLHSRFADAIKGLKSLASMQDAVNTALAHAKIEASELADRIETNRKALTFNGEADAYMPLFPDFAQVCTKQEDDFINLLRERVRADLERQEARIEQARKEEAERLEREAQDQRGKASSEDVKPVPDTRPADVLVAVRRENEGTQVANASTPPTPAYAVCEQHTPDLKTRLDQFFAHVGTPTAKQANYSAVIMAWEEFNGRVTKPADMEAAA